MNDNATKILVVEGEPLLRMTAIDILEDAGFVVREASNSEAAIAILQATPDLHVLFTDVQLPGDMDGIALAHLAARDYPNVGLIIVSGRVAPKPHELPKGAVFLAKPYEPPKMVAHVHRLRAMA